MDSILNKQLAQIKVQEMLQEAAEARADRKTGMAHLHPMVRKLIFVLAALPIVLWIVWVIVAG